VAANCSAAGLFTHRAFQFSRNRSAKHLDQKFGPLPNPQPLTPPFPEMKKPPFQATKKSVEDSFSFDGSS
jgi:hypothetical protein